MKHDLTSPSQATIAPYETCWHIQYSGSSLSPCESLSLPCLGGACCRLGPLEGVVSLDLVRIEGVDLPDEMFEFARRPD
jgi:hypothetical protein